MHAKETDVNVDFPNFLRMLLHQFPTLILYVVGIILCIVS